MFMKIISGVNLTKAFFDRYSSSGEECLPLACKNILGGHKRLVMDNTTTNFDIASVASQSFVTLTLDVRVTCLTHIC
jgi:hypothetical protein